MALTGGLPPRHLLLGLLVILVWGSNFVAIKLILDVMPPLCLAVLRFTLVALPAIFLLERPQVPLSNLAAYGLLVGAGQFGLLYLGMQAHVSPGLASLVIQCQVIFTIGLALALEGERPRPHQILAVIIAFAGILLIALKAGGAATPLGLALVIAASLCSAGANLLIRRNGRVNMLAYVVWASPFSLPPLLILSLLIDGWPAIQAGLSAATGLTWGLILWQSIGNTMFGFAAWGWLLARHPAATVTPLALLGPVIAMASSAWLLGEPLPLWKLSAAALVLGGLALNLFWRGRRDG